MLPAARWYFDADTIGPGKVLSHVRDDVTWPGDDGRRKGRAVDWLPACPVASTDVDDDVWIPTVVAAGMRIVTRDLHIMSRLRERAAVVESGAQMFAITSNESLSGWGLLEVVVSRWRDMENAASSVAGPFIFGVTRSGLRRLL